MLVVRYMKRLVALVSFFVLLSCIPQSLHGQDAQPPDQSAQRLIEPATTKPTSNPPEPQHKRIFGILPNYRTFPSMADYQPLDTKGKFKIATQDAFDRGTFVLAAAFAGYGQAKNSTPQYGQGVEGYSKYFAASFANWAIGDYMTEAVFPTMLHQDPRYFRKGEGSGFSRFGYAVKQIFWTRQDSGRGMFNFSEIGGNSAAVAISQAYTPNSRTPGDALSMLGLQVGLDMGSNVLKEFWPDIARKFGRKHASQIP